MKITYPVNPNDIVTGQPLVGRYKVTDFEDGTVIQEYWADFLCTLAIDKPQLAVGGTATVTATFTNYDGSPCTQYPDSVLFTVGNGSQTVNVVNGQAVTTITSSTAGEIDITCAASNVRGDSGKVTFQ